MSLSDDKIENFKTLLRASKNKDLCLVHCQDRNSGQDVSVICAVHVDEGQYVFTPLAKMFTDNPYEEVVFPSSGEELRADWPLGVEDD